MMGALTCTVASAASGRSFIVVLHLTLLLVAVRSQRQLKRSALDCTRNCVCASNIISCSDGNLIQVPAPLPQHTAVLDLSFNSITQLRAGWTTVDLSSLQSLILSNNGLTFLSTEAFIHVTKLRYLDLSFNGLRQLDELTFEPLEHLEVLLLLKNNISQIDRSAFSSLSSLQKLYMSNNLISRFPVEVLKERSRLETFQLLDVSSNRIKTLPLKELQALRAWTNKGVYFHSNPLTCSCALYDLLAQWQIKELNSVVHFNGSHTCVVPGGPQKQTMPILDLDKAYLNCTEVKALKEEAYLHQFLLLDCDTRLKSMVKRWVLPENASPSLANKTVVVSEDYLRIGPLKAEDSGVYTCYATGDSLNETLHITVVVFNYTMRGGLESLKTAYTTLVACLISLVMVLVYLYVAPCCCSYCPDQDTEKDGDPRGSLHSSTVSLTQGEEETEQQRAEGIPYIHTALLEHKGQLEQNGRLNPIGEEDEEWQDNRKRRRSDAESISSVYSDTPMVI
ncbi:amphoterin-induced protein 1 [Nothobranchius furzeri]|uniref:Adhesion molecule with Ig-like domain 1 n=3 Tax=Nothobranchius TaxID=28779 RepID=A0A1A8VF22_NOTFU|nr:amphoterin-induced protein 1-like [Nothobranchius furzeri]